MATFISLLLPLACLLTPVPAIVVREPATADYDYVVVGGGVSGITVASRLSEDSKSSVLVIEAGPILDGQKEFDDLLVQRTFDNLDSDRSAYTWPDIIAGPIEELNNRTRPMAIAKIAGGGSAVNGKLFARGGRRDYDDWARYLDDEGWGWESMLHYFKKAEKFTPPVESYTAQGNITWDMQYHGRDGPIDASFPEQFYPSTMSFKRAVEAMGFEEKDQASGDPVGSIWYPSSVRPGEYTRSYSKNEYYDPVKDRPNLHFLADNTVTRILFDGKKAVGVEYAEDDGASVKTARAKEEVIVAGGPTKTAQLLQVSGVGPKKLLKSLGVTPVVDLPVGENYQDHTVMQVSYDMTLDFDERMWTDKKNKTWMDLEYQKFLDTRTGYYTAQGTQHMLLISLTKLHGSDKAKSLLAHFQNKTHDPTQYLRPEAQTDDQTAKSYKRQHRLILESMATEQQAVNENAYQGTRNILVKPLSRGFIEARSTNIWDPPIINHRTLSHPLDLANVLASLRISREITARPEMRSLSPVETAPGTEVQSDEELIAWIRNSMSPGTAHGCCAAPLGTVLDNEMRVRGVEGLRVVDVSSWPFIPGAHTSQCTAYAVAERAADLIRGITELT